jgi:hypothetical protein
MTTTPGLKFSVPHEVLDHPQAKRKSKIQPNRVPDDLGRKAMTTIEGILNLAHAACIAGNVDSTLT